MNLKVYILVNAGFAVLEETEMPDDLHVAGAPYAGPELVWGT